ncbi:MAG: pro-sigmaK processing inhibitor BofA family protein [Candidatus Cohnella colombiensis]|uniref:Pro-sigmaK processing inhibitor BofA family protein n=1 Tax=Candidatus Cohnella colombiensis TaxID=3121368 RepID=A0AA95EWQ9_9BACL|nr:MAG: pro-sigmaK processing inhibitor BofA family protein [Cohnella sp.]
MKVLWMIILIGSLLSLAIVMFKRKSPKGWIKRFAIHLIMAAMALYALNYSGWLIGTYIPMNPTTIGTVAILGLPGVLLILGMQWIVIT